MNATTCPTCDRPIPPPGETCLRCGGFSASWGLFKREMDPAQAALLWKQAKAAEGDPERPCPVCRLFMHPFSLKTPDGTLSVRLDLCTGCQTLWFDQGEVEALPPHAKERILAFRERSVRGPVPLNKADLQYANEQGFSDGFDAGFLSSMIVDSLLPRRR